MRNSYRTRGRGAPRRQGDRIKNMFFKLLKDENAEMRSKFEAGRFIEGMVSFASKAELLGLLDDNRYYGSDRLKEALAFIEDNREIDEILVPMVMCLVDEEINRPLYKKARIRIVATIYSVPGLISHLTEPDILEMLSPNSAQIICSLLELMVMTLVEARNCKDVQTLAKSFKKDGVDGAEKLCNLLLINENGQTPPQAESLSFTSSSVVACWVSDKRPPGGRHDNDHENYRDVRLVPTQEEISCETPPWLPLFSQENAVIENLEMRLLDTNFRLLREDAVASIRSNIEEKKGVWNNARVVGLTRDYGSIGKGKVQPLSFIVQLGSLYARKGTNWERSRVLPHEGIIALCDPVDKNVQRLGTITARLHKEKDKWLHDKYGPVIGVSFHNSEDIISSLQEVADNSAVLARAKLESGCSFTAQSWSQVEAQSWSQVEKLFLNYDLIEASGSFFSYRPILSALQEFASVPLARQLAHLNPENQRPDYIPSTMSMPKTEFFNGYSCDFDHWSTQDVVSNTSLDESQAAAIHHALTSKVALIQGPPDDVKGVAMNVAFITHVNPEKGGNSDINAGTKINAWEADMCVEMVRYLLLQGYRHDQITILTPYVGQVIRILNVMKTKMKDTSAYVSELDREQILNDMEEEDDDFDVTTKETSKAIRCSSIDNFQGEESDIIVVSLVRSNKNGIIGFLKEEQRVNVLLSRARIGLYIVGNSTTLRKSKKGAWTPILDKLKNDGALLQGFPVLCQLHPKDAAVQIFDPAKFRELCPNGGCTRPCKSRLQCGHACPQACHPTDRGHLIAHKQCFEPCRRIPPECHLNHPCQKRCNQECGKCKTVVDPVILTCGHNLEKPYCFEVRDQKAIERRSKECTEKVEHKFSACGHVGMTTCRNSQSDKPKCSALCEKKMECDHLCQKRCSECDGNHACKVKCQKTLLCGHTCDKKCHGDSPCPPCQNRCGNTCVHSQCEHRCSSKCSSCIHDCDWQCEHMGKCPVVCGAPCTRLPCQERCKKKLTCGHQCPSVCGETCPPAEFCQICCDQHTKEHVVDMIEFTKYGECDLNEDPMILLPCGHFYLMSTLDGIFDMNQAFEIDANGDFIGIKPLSMSQDIKPKCCPDCRTVVHSIGRYGRLVNFLRLRFLERKHLISVEMSLKACAYKLSQADAKKETLVNITEKLEQVMKEIKSGPTQKVFMACGGNDQVEVPPPPNRPIMRTLQLLAMSYSRRVEVSNDENYSKAINKFKTVLLICDETHRLGAETRLSFSKLLLQWNDAAKVRNEICSILDPVLTHNVMSKFTDICNEAKAIKEQAKTGGLKAIIQAMNIVDGYDYGGSWSSHWYECPNGHPYFIGNCGGAMETSRCIECGAAVGGSNHRLVGSNSQSDTVSSILRRS